MSELRVETISNNAGTGPVTLTGQWASNERHRIRYGTTPASLDEGKNISSITDNGVGNITISLTNSYVTAFYGVGFATTFSTASGTGAFLDNLSGQSPGSYQHQTYQNAVLSDGVLIAGMSSGDLA